MIHGSELGTPRLRIRPFRESDRDALVSLFADPLVARYVDDGQPLSEAVAELWIRRSRENLALHGYGTGAVVEKGSDALIGWAGFARPEGADQEIIYGLARAHWGKGYGRELLRGLVVFAQQRELSPVKATVHPANTASIRLLVSSGFRRVLESPDEDELTHVYCL
jgi:RimJ/RimL family protein N-acetyltransferase